MKATLYNMVRSERSQLAVMTNTAVTVCRVFEVVQPQRVAIHANPSMIIMFVCLLMAYKLSLLFQFHKIK